MSPPPAEQFAARILIGPALRAQPDRRLVALVRNGYDAAFEEIVRRYRRPLDRFAAGIVGGRSEDVTQDAFSKALAALRGSEAEIELRPWLYRIVRNTALNDLRDRSPAAEELSERLPGARSAAAEVEGREELRDLMQRLQALPEPQRAALVMRELEGLSHEEIAAALGVSGGAARQAIYRARAALREGLGLLVPLPALRIFAEHGAEMVKAGAATVLIAGTVGAGAAFEHQQTGSGNSGVAEAAPPAGKRHGGAEPGGGPVPSSSPGAGASRRRSGAEGDEGRHGDGGADGAGAVSEGGRSGSGGPGPGEGSNQGSGPGSGEDDGPGDRRGGSVSDSAREDGGGSGSGPGSGDDGGSSGSGGGEDGLSRLEDDAGSSGPGSGEVASEPSGEPELSGSDGGGGSGGSGEGSGASGGSSGPGGGETTTEAVEPGLGP